ncbi:MAG: HNH endonuclease [Pseudacidovorax sp.]|nr:HNH endonuclease [Pseudacidovorax sp.]
MTGKLYRNKEWAAYRAKVIEADGHACTTCGARASHGAKLQVHHVGYIPGFRPWDYPLSECRTLCKGCHAAEHGVVPPKVGWTLYSEDDLGGLNGECELCGQPLRYVFSVFHAQWGTMDVGTDCCDNLTATSQAGEAKERRERRLGRLRTFLKSPNWRPHSASHHWMRKDGFELIVRRASDGYLIQVDDKPGKQRFATMVDAKKKLFYLLNSNELVEYRMKRHAAAEARRWDKFHGGG